MGYMAGKMDNFLKNVSVSEIVKNGNAKDLFNKGYFLVSNNAPSFVQKEIIEIRDEIIKTQDMEAIFMFTLQLGFITNTINEELKNIILKNCTKREIEILGFN